MNNTYYVYALLNPINNYEPFYIGKGNKGRVKWHFHPSSLKSKTYKNNIIKLYRSLGYRDYFVILASNLSEELSIFMEIYFISYFGRKGIDKDGILCNISPGGEGSLSGDLNPNRISSLNGKFLTVKRIEYYKKVSNIMKNRVESGTHNFISNHPGMAKIKDGTHNFLGDTHPNFNKKPWNNTKYTKKSRLAWYYADILFDIKKENDSFGHIYLHRALSNLLKVEISIQSTVNILKLFRLGWNPKEDTDWLVFKKDFIL